VWGSLLCVACGVSGSIDHSDVGVRKILRSVMRVRDFLSYIAVIVRAGGEKIFAFVMSKNSPNVNDLAAVQTEDIRLRFYAAIKMSQMQKAVETILFFKSGLLVRSVGRVHFHTKILLPACNVVH